MDGTNDGQPHRLRRAWVVGAAAASVLVAASAWWLLLADRSGSSDAADRDSQRPTSTTAIEVEEPEPPGNPALVAIPPWSIDQPERRGHVALVSGGETVLEELGLERHVALSPDGARLAFLRSTDDRDRLYDTVVRRLSDGHEDVVDGTACPRFSPEGRLVTVGPDLEGDGTRVDAFDRDLARMRSFQTSNTLYCAGWDQGDDRLVAVSRDQDERLNVWTIEIDGDARGGPVEGLHPESHVMLGPSLERGRFLVLVPSQHPPFSTRTDRWELGELIVAPDGQTRYERIVELAAVPDWSHPDRTLLSPRRPVPLGMAHAQIASDGTLVLSRSDTASYLVVDGLTGNLFAIDAAGDARYLTTGVREVSIGPGGIADERLGVPLVLPEWIARAPTMDRSPCEGQGAVDADVTGDGHLDQVFHDWLGDFGMPVIGVCTADGVVDSVAGRAQAELGGTIELGPDGWSVLVAGGTSASWGGFDVAVVVDDRIRWVELDGEFLAFWDGHKGVGAEGLAEQGGAHGCEDLTGDGTFELVQVEVDASEGQELATWEKRGYRIEGTSASLVLTDSGTVQRSDYLWDVADSLTRPCPRAE